MQTNDRELTLHVIKQRPIDINSGFGHQFHNHLQCKLETLEFADHIRCWFPKDDKLRRQLIIVTHNPNVLANRDAEMVPAFYSRGGQCRVGERGALQELPLREEVCRAMEGSHEAFARLRARLGREL